MTPNASLFTGTLVLALVSAALMTSPRIACAHGDETHAAGPASKEQTPWGIAGSPPAMALAAEMTDGEVRKVNKETNKITIKHGEIKSLDMPPMTMVFQVKDAGLLDKVKPGDKVRFAAEKSAGGALVVTEIEVTP